MISPLAYVDPAAKLGENVTVHPFAYIDANVEIGDNCEIMPYASIMKGTRMGNDCKVYQGAIVSADPQDFRWKGGETYCYIGNEVVIRENVIINRGIYDHSGTRIGDKCFIMAEAHIGHDTHVVGRNVLGNGATVAGDAVIGEGSIISSNAIVNEKVNMGRYALLKGGTRVSSNVPPFVIIAHNPASYYGVNAVSCARAAISPKRRLTSLPRPTATSTSARQRFSTPSSASKPTSSRATSATKSSLLSATTA